jgi:hypothetical protein
MICQQLRLPSGVRQHGMNLIRKRKGCVFVGILIGLLCLVLVSHLSCRNRAPWNIKAVLLLKGQPIEFYFRNRCDPVLGGRILSKVQTNFPRLAKFSWGDNLVRRRTLGCNPDKIKLVFVVDGYFPECDDLGAEFVMGEQRFPAKVGKWSWKDKEQHKVFLTTPSFKTPPRSGAFVITNRHSGVTLFTYKF